MKSASLLHWSVWDTVLCRVPPSFYIPGYQVNAHSTVSPVLPPAAWFSPSPSYAFSKPVILSDEHTQTEGDKPTLSPVLGDPSPPGTCIDY